MTVADAMESIMRYVDHGILPGGFLRSVLENDLMEAIGMADMSSRANLFEICQFIYNEIPGVAHGSPQKVAKWIQKKRQEAESKEKEL